MSDSTVQHKSVGTPPSGFGFDDAGGRVPVTWPDGLAGEEQERGCGEEDAARIRQETIVRVFYWLYKSGDSDPIGRRALMAGYKLKLPGAPRTQEELGARMGVTEGRACQLLKELNSELAAFTKDLE